jgi:hypothetical protein
MRYISRDIFLQSFAVLDRSEDSSSRSEHDEPQVARTLSVTAPTASEMASATGVLNATFSSTPVVWKSELAAQYRDLGHALSHMAGLDADDQLMIEKPVYAAASFFATMLLMRGYPAPKVFTHGSKSVVFNWMNGPDNLYLTISADRLSVLVTTPKNIETRINLSAGDGLDPLKILGTISPRLKQQDILVLPSGSSEPADLLG